MKFDLKQYQTKSGEILLYCGAPNFEKLEILVLESGDIWHNSFEQGYKNAFPELVYQTAVFFWYLNDFDGLDQCVSWRINPNAFVIRKSVWDALNGFDEEYQNKQLMALDFGYNALRNSGAIPLYVKDLFVISAHEKIKLTATDRYVFFRKNFKIEHSFYMLYRKGFWRIKEWKGLLYAIKNFQKRVVGPRIAPRKLNAIQGKPTVSYIIPTMMRQDFTLNLLNDLKQQTYPPSQVIVVDATPIDQLDFSLYNRDNYPFEVQFQHQNTQGSCRARNEAIALCVGAYIVFGDDDIRIPPDFIENHIRLLQTYNAVACNGLDIRADNQSQNLEDLQKKILGFEAKRWIVGATQMFSNANSCVKRTFVNQLVGNDINFDGGYGEDSDFGMSLSQIGVVVLHNPFSVNLHLKPATGGYRFWGNQAKFSGKLRKKQPWELDVPVQGIYPVPSPTVLYGILKHYTAKQALEYKKKYFFLYLFKGSKIRFLWRIIRIPYKNRQYAKSLFYARKLLMLGKRTK